MRSVYFLSRHSTADNLTNQPRRFMCYGFTVLLVMLPVDHKLYLLSQAEEKGDISEKSRLTNGTLVYFYVFLHKTLYMSVPYHGSYSVLECAQSNMPSLLCKKKKATTKNMI